MREKRQTSIMVNTPDGGCKEFQHGISLYDVAKHCEASATHPILLAKVNNEVVNLGAALPPDSWVVLLDYTSEEGFRAFQRSLALVLIRAVKELFSGADVKIEHSISNGLFCEMTGVELNDENSKAIERQMRDIVQLDEAFTSGEMSLPEAIQLFTADGRLEKANLLKDLPHESVCIHKCGWFLDSCHGPLVPSTGYLDTFAVRRYASGVILEIPQKHNPKVLPPFVEHNKLAKVFKEAEQWGKILQCGYVADLNAWINQNQHHELIRVAEALHEKKLAQMADTVAEQRDNLRIILIAGPSSSGKTTFAQRLAVQMKVNGLRPVSISLDDYFVDRDNTPRDEQGNYDFEALEAIDIPLFNEHLLRLMRGETVKMPTFNFVLGQREYRGYQLRVDHDQPIIIEGIHGLNERLTREVPTQNKFKIYISAITQISIDAHNRIPTTDARLIRRIVRDSQFRDHDAIRTIRMWPSVRRGEERNIFPYQEEANTMFNSALIYELAALRPYAEPLLRQVSAQQPEYSEAKRLLDFLALFRPIDKAGIPSNSILCEFIGGSCF